MFWNTIHLHFIRSEGLATIKKEFTVAAIREVNFGIYQVFVFQVLLEMRKAANTICKVSLSV